MSARLKIYWAAPLFNEIERRFNSEMTAALADIADVFLPQRDGMLLAKLVADGWPVEESRRRVFDADINAIMGADIVIGVLDGRTVDEGVAFELGFAAAFGKYCVAYKSDDRILLPTGDNPMIMCGCQNRCSSLDELRVLLESERAIRLTKASAFRGSATETSVSESADGHRKPSLFGLP